MALSELGLMYPLMVQWGQAKVIKLFILMDVDTHSHNHTYMRTDPLPTSRSTQLSWLHSTQTHLLTRQAARKEVNIWGVEATWPCGQDTPLTVDKL